MRLWTTPCKHTYTVLQQSTQHHFLGAQGVNTKDADLQEGLSAERIHNFEFMPNQAIMPKILGDYFLSFFHRCDLRVSKVMDEREMQNSICCVPALCWLSH